MREREREWWGHIKEREPGGGGGIREKGNTLWENQVTDFPSQTWSLS